MAVQKKPVKAQPGNIQVDFSKDQLLKSARFQGREDVLDALLSPDQRYTMEEVEQKVSAYLKGQVK